MFGISAQSTEYQREFVRRFTLTFPLLSDAEYRFTRAVGLPTIVVEGERLLHRVAIVADPNRRIQKVFDEIERPAENAREVLTYLRQAADRERDVRLGREESQ